MAATPLARSFGRFFAAGKGGRTERPQPLEGGGGWMPYEGRMGQLRKLVLSFGFCATPSPSLPDNFWGFGFRSLLPAR